MDDNWLTTVQVFLDSLKAQMRKRNDQPRPETPQADYHSDSDEPRDIAADVPEGTENQDPSSTANHSSGFRASAGVFTGFFRMASSHVTKIKHTVIKVGDSINDAVETAKKTVKNLDISAIAKGILNWAQQHPWKTALIVVPLVSLAVTEIVLFAIGFGPGGIAAGSTAAVIHAGIGNIAAHSLFATCTSAMMGGYGAPIIFGGVWAVATLAVASCRAAWKRWHCQKERRIVCLPTVESRTTFEAMDEAATKVVLGVMLAAAYLTYRVKSWRNAWGNPGSPSE